MDREHPTELTSLRATMGEFEVVLRGYDRGQVRETIERLDADIRIALADRDAAVARSSDLASQLSAMHAELESLRRKVASSQAPTFETMGERIAHMLRLAEEESAEIRHAALTDTAAMRAELATASEEAEARRTEIEQSAASIISAAEERAAAGLAEAEEQAAATAADAEQRAATTLAEAQASRDELISTGEGAHKQANEDFEISLRARRSEASRTEAERHRSSTEEATRRVTEAKSGADRLIAAARADAERTLAAAQADSDRLQDLRERAVRQLRDVRALLDSLPTEEIKAAVAVAAAAEGAVTPPANDGTSPGAEAESAGEAESPGDAADQSPVGGDTVAIPQAPRNQSPRNTTTARANPAGSQQQSARR